MTTLGLGRFNAKIEKAADGMIINGHKVRVTKQPDTTKVMWGEGDADYVLECSGQVLTKEKA